MILHACLALCALLAAQDQPARTAIAPVPESPEAQERVAGIKDPRSVAIYEITDLAQPQMSRPDPGESEAVRQFRDSYARRDREHLDDPHRDLESMSYSERVEIERLDAVVAAIREYVRPKFLNGIDELNVHGRTTMVVTGTAEHHAWIRNFLALQRDRSAPFLMLQSHQVRASAEAFERLGFEGPTAIIEDPAEAGRVVETLVGAKEVVEVLSAPQLMISQGSPAEVSVMNQVSYVKNYEVVYVHPGPTAIADPVIDIVQEGVFNRMIGMQIEPGLYALDIEVERSEIERPIPTKEIRVTVDVETPVTISQPTVLTSKLSSTVLLRDGGAVWFRVPDGEQELMVFVQMKLVPIPPSDPLPAPKPEDCPVPDDPTIGVEEQPLRPGERRAQDVPD